MISQKDKAPKEPFSIPWDEVIRNPNQERPKEGSKAWDYWKNCAVIQNLFLKEIRLGSLKSYSTFTSCYEDLHNHLLAPQVSPPKLRSTECFNSYPFESQFAHLTAKTLFDPFFFFHIFTNSPSLPNISNNHLPKNLLKKHIYPHPNSFPEYLAEAHKQILIIQNPLKSIEEKLFSISLFYQYLINSRIFHERNNSYLMVLSNTFLHYLGLKGISHYILDHLAHRLHYRNFAIVFIGAVILENPSLSKWVSLKHKEKEELCNLFNHHTARVLFRSDSKDIDLIQVLHSDMTKNAMITPENRKAVMLHFSFLERLSLSQKDHFLYAPQCISSENKRTVQFPSQLNDLVIFCAEWYYLSYPLNIFFIRNFPNELPRNSTL